MNATTKRALTNALLITAAALVFIVAAGLTAWLHLDTPLGRRAAARTASSLMSRHLSGRFEVSGVRSLDLPRIHADGFRAYDGDVEVLHLEDVAVELDIAACVRERGFHVRSGSVGGGWVSIASANGDTPGIERVFDDGGGSSGDGGDSGDDGGAADGRRPFRVESLEISSLDVRLAVGHPLMRFAVSTGRGRMWLHDGSDFQGRFWSIAGSITEAPSPVPSADFAGVALTIDPLAQPLVRFAGRVDLLGSRSTVAGHAPASGDTAVRICVWSDGALTQLGGIGTEVLDDTTSSFAFDLRTSEPPSDPRCEESNG